MAEKKLVMIVSTSTDRRTEHIGGYFLDMRSGSRNGKQLRVHYGPKSKIEELISSVEAQCPADAEVETIIESTAWNNGEELGPR